MLPDRSPDTADRLEDLFQRASDLDPATRAAFLDRECAGDAALRQAVAELLDSSARSGAWDRCALLNEARRVSDFRAEDVAIDRYQLCERIGAGGMGVVYKAVRADDSYSKVVAVKIVHPEFGGDRLLERFLTERQILARLEHPNIALLLDGGTTTGGLPFLVMEHVEGVPVDHYVRERGLSIRQTLELFRKICAAVSCAHSQLVVHRDLKPANILVTPAGEPKLLDFGIAKLLDSSSEGVHTRHALTPEYASPEQIRGDAAGIATDVYSLGTLLYRLLSGRSPYGDIENAFDLSRAICEAPPLPLPEIDPELETVVQMALRKEPARRYDSVEQFSDDVARYLRGYPVRARPDTRAYRARKFVHRNRLAVAGGALILTTLVAGIVATSAERWRAEREQARAENAEARSRRSLYAAQMSLAFQAWEQSNVVRANDLLEAQVPKPGDADLRGFEWRLLWRLTHVASRILRSPAEFVRSVAVSPDGSSIVAATDAGVAQLWNIATGKLERSFAFEWPCNVTFSPDGKLLAGAGEGGAVIVRRVDTGDLARTLPGNGAPASIVTFSADGAWLATGSGDGAVNLYPMRGPTRATRLKAHSAPVASVAFSPDGHTLATAGHDHTARLWSVPSLEPIATLEGHSWWVLSAAFSPDGGTLATAGSDGDMRLWDAHTGRPAGVLHGDGVTVDQVAFSADGKWLAAARDDGAVHLYDAVTRRLAAVLRGHTDSVKWVDFSPDRQTVVTAAFDGSVRIWSLVTHDTTVILDGHRDWVWKAAFSPDNRTLATAGKDGVVKLWDFRARRLTAVLPHPQWVDDVAFSPDGAWLATADDDGAVRLWNRGAGALAATLSGHTAVVESVAFSPGGALLASSSRDGEVRLWDVPRRALLATFPSRNRKLIWSVAFSPDTKLLAAAEGTATDLQLAGGYSIFLWDLTTRRLAATLEGHTRDVRAIAFSPGGDVLASGSFDGTIRLWNAHTGAPIATLKTHKVLALAFSPDGKRLASAGQDKTVRIWDATSLEEVASLALPSQLETVAFSPDGAALAVGANDGKVRIWLAD